MTQNPTASVSATAGDGSVTITPLTTFTSPTFTKAFGASSIAMGSSTTLTFTITNGNTTTLTGVAFSDPLPAGLVVSNPAGISNACGGTVTANPGGSSISLTGGTVAASSSCTVSVNVTGTMSGSITNTSGAVSTTQTGTGSTAKASITVVGPPTITKAFGASTIAVGNSTSLTFTITNPNTPSISGISFIDPLPTGLVVSTPSAITDTCGGVVTAVAGGSTVSLAGGTLSGGTFCTVTANVTVTMPGTLINVTSPITSANGGNGGAATAAISVTNVPLDGSFQSKIFPNLSAGDSVINIGNTGASTSGNLCVNVYVFSPDEQEVACCTCFVTPNGVVTTSARQLISKTLTPAMPTAVTVKLIASDGSAGAASCNAAAPGAIMPGLIAFGTNIHAATAGGSTTVGTYTTTETPFIPATLSAAELSRTSTLCGFIKSNGTGFGVCPGCAIGGAGAERQ